MSKAQKLQLELMKLATFNEFDGEKVVQDLIGHQDLWSGAVMGRLDSLIQLRDVNESWNVDTLFILPRSERGYELECLARNWKADDIEWIGEVEACEILGMWNAELRNTENVILKVWWD